MKRPWLFSTILALGAVCSAASAGEATLIFTNGRIWTENPAQPEAQAVALDGNSILAVGDDATIKRLAGPGTQTIDLGGKRVLPGFNDAHVHFLDGGGSLIGVPLGDANSQAEFRDRIAKFAKTLPKGAWLRNGNWDHQRWNPAVLPTHQLIDEVSGDHPALLWRLDGHMALANAQAMKLAGLDKMTRDVPGGEIERDKDGNPTGILKDAATDLVEKVMPALSAEEKDLAMEAAMKEAASHGVTSVQNMADTSEDRGQADVFREFEKMDRAGKLTLRIYEALSIRDWKVLADAGVVAPFGGPHLRIGNTKSFADGALGSGTAWMMAPFTDNPGNSGLDRK